MIIDDAYNFLRSKGINGVHQTRKLPPTLTEVRDLGLASDYLGLCGHSGPVEPVTSATTAESSDHNGEITNGLAENGQTVDGHNDVDGIVNDHSAHHSIHAASRKSHPRLLILTAADQNGIERLAFAYSEHFMGVARDFLSSESYMSDLAYTLTARRSALAWRSFLVCDANSKLLNLQNHISKALLPAAKASLGLVFGGQGAQWPRMGCELVVYPVFKKSLLAADAYLRSLGCSWSLLGKF